MRNDTYISVYLPKSRIYIFRSAIKLIGDPKYVRFLVNEDGNSIIMEAYHKMDANSHRVPYFRENGHWNMAVYSQALCYLLQNQLDWQGVKSYRIPGKICSNRRMAVFNLSSAEPIL